MTNISIEKNADSINAIVRAVKVLDILSESSTPLGVSALAKKLVLPKVTTFRILNTLLLTGRLQKDSSDLYYLAPKFIIYGDKVKASFMLRSVAEAILQELTSVICESANLGVSYKDYLLTLIHVNAGFYSLVSNLTPLSDLNCSSMGKVILCHKDDQYIQEYFKKPLGKLTMNTVTSLDQFLDIKRKFDEEHIMFDDEEFEQDLGCFSIPIYDVSHQFIAAINVNGPKTRIILKSEWIKQALLSSGGRLTTLLAQANYTVEDFQRTLN